MTYKFYMATKLHFTTNNYDVFKNKAGVKISRDSFYKRNDRALFESLGKKFKEPRELIQYMVSNFAYSNENLVYTKEESDYNYMNWIKRKQSMSKFFQDDLNSIIKHCELNGKFELYNSLSEPYLFKLYLNKIIGIETLCILDQYSPFLDKWKSSHMLLLWESDIRRIEKCKSFVKYDDDKCSKLYYDFKKELDTL